MASYAVPRSQSKRQARPRPAPRGAGEVHQGAVLHRRSAKPPQAAMAKAPNAPTVRSEGVSGLAISAIARNSSRNMPICGRVRQKPSAAQRPRDTGADSQQRKTHAPPLTQFPGPPSPPALANRRAADKAGIDMSGVGGFGERGCEASAISVSFATFASAPQGRSNDENNKEERKEE